MTEAETLKRAAKNAGASLRIGAEAGDSYAVVLWGSKGPVIQGAAHNRVLICRSYEEAMIAVDVAGADLKAAKAVSGYYSA